MKSNIWTDAEWICLTPGGYHWNCPKCCKQNVETKFEDLVKCSKCGESFRVEYESDGKDSCIAGIDCDKSIKWKTYPHYEDCGDEK